ncbi:alpha/beta hydrolase [Polaromonas sp.]|uniref:alpha/beta hydrolase n=1 Tax=Polaromonas sp. TaxID=1869339 RepID=UPI0025D94835|nr:alpha/beta hydrolase [Polaromonas sp.]
MPQSFAFKKSRLDRPGAYTMSPANQVLRRVFLSATVGTLAALGGCGGNSSDDSPGLSGSNRSNGAASNTDPGAVATATSQTMPNSRMQAVLDQLAALGAKPIETLTVAQARTQPTPADAVKALLVKEGKSTAPEAVGSVVETTFPGPAGPVPISIYTPSGPGPFPVALYIHGGGWVIADRKVYDSSARALTNASAAIIVSTDYRMGPEIRFPAAHDDTFAAYQWVRANARQFNGDPARVAVVGESAGGNLAASLTLRARDQGVPLPQYQVLIYPVTNYAFDTPSQLGNTATSPLGTKALPWFFERYLNSPADGANPLFSVLRNNLQGLPPATVITADIDPLRSEGAAYAQKLIASGVKVDYRNYSGVTHEFFGMGAALDDAKQAVAQAANGLKKAFGN